MPQLLLEFFSEEIPARMQARAEADLERLLMDKLTAAGFLPEAVKAFAGPRRLAAVVEGLPAQQPDVSEEKKGPRVGAPEGAIQGFLKSAGLTAIEQAQVVEDKKGAFYVAQIHKPGRETSAILAEIVPEIIRAFPWPKSMRWADGDLYWVRPLQGILCVFEGEPIAFEVGGVRSGVATWGHRFHAPDAMEARNFEEYRDRLAAAHVLLTRAERKERILAEARMLCAAQELELIEDEGLLEEVAGLAEWPVPILGGMDPAFLELPDEVIRLTMRTHQRYFAVRDPKTRRLAPKFIAVANIEAKDGGAAIAAGNARVLSARLSDARFFWKADKARPLEALLPKLDRIVFHEKLGSVGDKARRVRAFAVELAATICPDDFELVREAAHLCKADLVSDTVGEFPELQGQVGGWLFALQDQSSGEPVRVADAIELHYRPLGPSDRVPTDPIAVCVALADKLDTLCGFWAIDEKPTGSKDPFALRRAALGVVRIILENGVRLSLRGVVPEHVKLARTVTVIREIGPGALESYRPILGKPVNPEVIYTMADQDSAEFHAKWQEVDVGAQADDLLTFLADRLKVQLREQGKRHDLVDAVFALGDDDLVRIVARVEALSDFLKTEDGATLLAGYRRAANILKAEEKKDPLIAAAIAAGEAPDAAQLALPAEQALLQAIEAVEPAAQQAVRLERFEAAMAELARLRAPVDAFFGDVLVNDPDAALRKNRLLLLARARAAVHSVTDFGRIEG